jgi:hypothetical protein
MIGMNDAPVKPPIRCNTAKPLPIQMVLDSLEYDPNSPSGLRWKNRPSNHFVSESARKTWNTAHAGKSAGAISQGKYWQVMINKVNYQGHRLVWCVFYKSDPRESLIDHINGNGFDNRIGNLRLATSSQNLRNKRKTDKNTSGFVGVTWDKLHQKWIAQIAVHRKNIRIGSFACATEAHLARKAAEARYHGEFSYNASQSAIII